jgi:hypothetical protein
VVKKAERQAKALAREARRQKYEREEAAMQVFLQECRASLPAAVWDKEFAKPERWAGETFHVVERIVSVLSVTQQPITPPLRQALDAMLDARGLDRDSTSWQDLRRLNYGAYWKSQHA